MANGGWYGSAEEWARLEAPLVQIDPVFSAFAKEFGLSVRKNHKNWPDRAIEWGNDTRLLSQLWLTDEKALTFDLWISASQDTDGKRHWKHSTLVKGKAVSDFEDWLPTLLREGREQLVAWSLRMDDAEEVPIRRLP